MWLAAQRRKLGLQFDAVLGAGETFGGRWPEPLLGCRHGSFLLAAS
jgi:hypothetical protein